VSSVVDETGGGSLTDVLGAFYSSGLPLNNHSNGLAATLVACSGYGYLISFTVLNTNAAAQYIQLHDLATVPASGAVPAVVFAVSATSNLTVAYTMPGRKFERGIVIANSSTAASYTAGSADCFFDVQYIPVAGS
jgi:hypothetical protein